MKLLQIIGTLNPTYGGHVEALGQLSLVLEKMGHQNEIVTLDSNNSQGVANIPSIAHALGPSYGRYRYNYRLLPWLRTNADRFDAVIIRGIWQYHSAATWLAYRKKKFHYFIFVHGALDPWFKRAYPLKHIKKWVYWTGVENKVLRDANAALFTSMEEMTLASQSFRLDETNCLVINYGIGSPQGNPDYQRKKFFEAFPSTRDKQLLLFLSRIHPKKGCDLLLDALAQIASITPNIHLILAGPDQEGWQSTLEKRAAKLGIEDKITWTGMLDGDLKWGAFHAADAFILPSHSENFGIAIVEALACSLPVLITDKVNIWREILEDKAGLVDNDTLDGVIRLLTNWLILSQDERHIMSENAINCFQNRFNIENNAIKFVDQIRYLSKA